MINLNVVAQSVPPITLHTILIVKVSFPFEVGQLETQGIETGIGMGMGMGNGNASNIILSVDCQ